MARMKMVAPPRHTPVSIRSPRTPRRITSSTQDWILSKRASGSMETAAPSM
jgi:hypothetical protein